MIAVSEFVETVSSCVHVSWINLSDGALDISMTWILQITI